MEEERGTAISINGDFAERNIDLRHDEFGPEIEIWDELVTQKEKISRCRELARRRFRIQDGEALTSD